MMKCNINLFNDDPPPPKNRRMTPSEFAEELILANAFKRPPRHFINDLPFYPYVIADPNKQCKVNFDLNYP